MPNDPIADAVLSRLGRDSKLLQSIYSQCFPKQLAYVTDMSARVAALCSRKAGKTGGKVRKLVTCALREPDSMAVYCANTIKSSMAAIWDNPDGLPTWLRKNRVDCKIFEEGLVEFPNGSLIRVTGADSRKTIDVWRTIRCNLWEIDEGQGFEDSQLKYMLEEVIPATQLVRGGQVSIGGTPEGRCHGYFHDITTGKIAGWSVHRWTWRDNPHIRNGQDWVEREKMSRGLAESDPAFRREFNGEWVREESSLAYRFYEDRNLFDVLPVAPEWRQMLAFDVGYNDKTAFSLGAWHTHSPIYYVREVYAEGQCLPSRIDAIIRSYEHMAEQEGNEINYKVMDCGALGKTIAEELRQEYGHNIIAAEKKEKKTFMAFMNDALRLGNMKLHGKKCAALIDQMNTLNVDEFGDEDQNQPNDLCDSTLYGFRHARAYLAEPAPVPKKHPGRIQPVDGAVVAARMLERAENWLERKREAEGELNGLLGDFETYEGLT